MSLVAQQQHRFHFVDGYRAIAVVLTILCHSVASNIEQYFKAHGMPGLGDFIGGFSGSGVDMFFAISGLVLLRPYLRNQRAFDTLTYFKKRFTRIYPTYFAALLLGAAVIWFINVYPTWYNERGVSAKFSVWETIKQVPMLNLDGQYYNLAWWSVQVEALFYILVPVIVFRFPHGEKMTNRMVTALVLGTLLVSTCLQLWLDAYYPWFYSYRFSILNMSRILDYPVCFLMGMLMAARDFSRKQAWMFIAGGAAILSLYWIHSPIEHAGWGIMYGGLLMLSFNSKPIQQFLSKPIFIWVGERSYSLFLVHLSFFYLSGNISAYFTTSRGTTYFILSRCIGYLFTLLASMALFQLVERRFARGLITDKMIWPWQTNKMRQNN